MLHSCLTLLVRAVGKKQLGYLSLEPEALLPPSALAGSQLPSTLSLLRMHLSCQRCLTCRAPRSGAGWCDSCRCKLPMMLTSWQVMPG